MQTTESGLLITAIVTFSPKILVQTSISFILNVMNIKNVIWTAPFVCFLCGYFIAQKLSSIDYLNAPALVGKQLQEAVTLLSKNNLNIRLIAEREDDTIPSGTILLQTPTAGQAIKAHQSIHVVLSKKPKPTISPNLIGMPITQIQDRLNKKNIKSKNYLLPSNYPFQQCIAQYPPAGKDMITNTITIYLSSGNKKPVLLPSFQGKTVPESLEFLNSYPCTIHISHNHTVEQDHACTDSCRITAQRPLAGSIITLDKDTPFAIHFQAKNTQ